MLSQQIRKSFIDYFVAAGHAHVPSSSLIPKDDPSLLFVNSGMVQFKNIFLGLTLPDADKKTAVTVQKCLRAGGKHNDLDNVGYTARHHTFFEMLGNFSFGDYFKERAIELAFNFVIKELQLPKQKLLVTVFQDDDDAVQLWKKIGGFSDNHIIRLGHKDNFWQMGDTGPCGPCSEIFYDHGDGVKGGAPGSATADGDRFIEIWNLVFMQYEQKLVDGQLQRSILPNPAIDTGMGLERISAVLQGVTNNFDTDLFQTIIHAIEQFSPCRYQVDAVKPSFRVISDHLRAAAFLIADGVIPNAEGMGYVLRRILRRGMRHADLLKIQQPLFHQLVPSLIKVMGGYYHELVSQQKIIQQVMLEEEQKFRQLLERGLKLLDLALEKLPTNQPLAGEVAFELYDTYGFPLDLTLDILRQKNIGLEQTGFDKNMQAQQKRARAGARFVNKGGDLEKQFARLYQTFGKTKFLGYEQLEAKAVVQGMVEDSAIMPIAEPLNLKSITAGDKYPDRLAWLVFAQTPFYGESGGQEGDRGEIIMHGHSWRVLDTQRYQNMLLHLVALTDQPLSIGDEVLLKVNSQRRANLQRHHSATHLLHEALRANLGKHVTQKGSLVNNDYLRFDFSHGSVLAKETLNQLEQEVNAQLHDNQPVLTQLMSPSEAVARGAIALFGEKYGDEVRVVLMGRAKHDLAGNHANNHANDEVDNNWRNNYYSIELCGGTHVQTLSDIKGQKGYFLLQSQEAVGSGVRRLQAIAGDAAYDYAEQQLQKILTEIITIKNQTEIIRKQLNSQPLPSELSNLPMEPNLLQSNLAVRTPENFRTNEQVLKQQLSAWRQYHDQCQKQFSQLQTAELLTAFKTQAKSDDVAIDLGIQLIFHVFNQPIKQFKPFWEMAKQNYPKNDGNHPNFLLLLTSESSDLGEKIVCYLGVIGGRDNIKKQLQAEKLGQALGQALDEYLQPNSWRGGGRVEMAQFTAILKPDRQLKTIVPKIIFALRKLILEPYGNYQITPWDWLE